MFQFLSTHEKRRAFKKALNEIVHEKPEPVVAQPTARAIAQRTTISLTGLSIKNPLRKPETKAIDLKYFKDWRKVDKVPSNNPIYPEKPKPKAEPEKEVKTQPSSEIISTFSKPKEEKKDLDFSSFLDEINKKIHSEDKPAQPAPAPIKKEQKPAENKIKIEVVDLEPKPVSSPKPAVKRRTRGKSKRRFDADVISAVDWKS